MRIALKKYTAQASLLLVIAVPVDSLAAPRQEPASSIALVTKLYKDFAWQALGATQDIFGKPLQQRSDATLLLFFEPGLAALIAKDRECVSQRAEVCNMDFDPLFGSQDPTVTDFTIQQEGAGRVTVAFASPSSGEKVRLLFQVRQAGNAWRINDIVYQDLRGASLRKMLSTKLPGNK